MPGRVAGSLSKSGSKFVLAIFVVAVGVITVCLSANRETSTQPSNRARASSVDFSCLRSRDFHDWHDVRLVLEKSERNPAAAALQWAKDCSHAPELAARVVFFARWVGATDTQLQSLLNHPSPEVASASAASILLPELAFNDIRHVIALISTAEEMRRTYFRLELIVTPDDRAITFTRLLRTTKHPPEEAVLRALCQDGSLLIMFAGNFDTSRDPDRGIVQECLGTGNCGDYEIACMMRVLRPYVTREDAELIKARLSTAQSHGVVLECLRSLLFSGDLTQDLLVDSIRPLLGQNFDVSSEVLRLVLGDECGKWALALDRELLAHCDSDSLRAAIAMLAGNRELIEIHSNLISGCLHRSEPELVCETIEVLAYTDSTAYRARLEQLSNLHPLEEVRNAAFVQLRHMNKR